MTGCQNACIDKLRTYWEVGRSGKVPRSRNSGLKPPQEQVFLPFDLDNVLHLFCLKGAGLSRYEMLCYNNEVSYQFCFHYKTFVNGNQKGYLIFICERLKISGVKFSRITELTVELHLFTPGWNFVPDILFMSYLLKQASVNTHFQQGSVSCVKSRNKITSFLSLATSQNHYGF